MASISKQFKQLEKSTDSESVHKARQHIKKLRALLRLIRGELDREIYHRQNAALRKMARALSGMRESTIQLKTLATLRRSHPVQLSKKEFQFFKKILLRAHRRQPHALKASKAFSKKKLKRLKHEINRWKIDGIKARDLQLGIKKTRNRFLDAHQQARLAPDDKTIHEWRKRTKDFLYQSQFLENLRPEFFVRQAEWLGRLGEYLGDAHDLAMLETKIAVMKPVFTRLLKLSEQRRIQLQTLAFTLVAKNQDTFPCRF
jgi:CHAD domain-containing protein